MKHLALAAFFGLMAAGSFYFWIEDERPQRSSGKQSDKFSNILLHTQHGKPVRFYDDLIKDKTVVINLMFIGCGDICPATTATLARAHELLGPKIGREITLLSISIDPAGDTPERLRMYWEKFGAKPGWLYLAGKPREIELLRRQLGLYDRDPKVDADITQHSGLITIGNDRTNRWTALPALADARELAATITRISSLPQGDAAGGGADYARYCAACHGAAGAGDGPLAALLARAPARHSQAAHMQALSDEYLFRLLKEGGPAFGKSPLMGVWGRVLSDQQITDLIAFLRQLPDRHAP